MSEQNSSRILHGFCGDLCCSQGVISLQAQLKKRSDIHWARKIWHMLGVSIIAFIYSQTSETLSLWLLCLAWLVFVPADLLRLRSAGFNDFAVSIFGPFMRQSEVDKLAGTTYLISGLTVIAFLFPKDIVLLTMLFLAFADPIASYFGIRYGRDKIFGQKSLQGTMAAFVVCTILSYAFFKFYGLMQERALLMSIIGGFIGAMSELIPIGKIDDNFTLPVLSASALWLVFSALGMFGLYI